LVAHPKSKKLSFGPNISFDDIWNVHPLQFKDPVWDQPRFAFQACEKVAHSGCMVRFCTALRRAGVSLDGLRGNKCGQPGQEHDHHFTNPYDFEDWRGLKDAFVWEAKSPYQMTPQPGVAAYKFVSGKQGVVLFKNYFPMKMFTKAHPTGITELRGGHIDLWNKDRMGNDIGIPPPLGSNNDSCFLRSSRIVFWPM